jgi:hypothetical protein
MEEGMERQHREALNEIVFMVLRNPTTVTSDEFMAGYDIIYKFCTQPTLRYEIKGAPIYNLLADTAKKYSDNLESFASVEDFNAAFVKFNAGVSMLTKLCEYLERYYIKTSIMKRDPYVRDIKGLFYYHYYTNYVDKLKIVFEKLILLEVAKIRNEKSDTTHLKTAIDTYRTLLLCSGNEQRYAVLKDTYLAAFKKEVNYNDPINKLLQVFYKELSIVMEIFDNVSYHHLARKMVFDLATKSSEIVSYILRKIERKRSFFHAYKILEILGPVYIAPLVRDLELFIENRLKNCTNFDMLFGFFLDLNIYLEHGFNKNKGVKKLIHEKFLHAVRSFLASHTKDAVDAFLTAFVDKVGTIDDTMDKNVLKSLLSFFSLIEKKDIVGEKITFNLQKRLLLASRDLKLEQFLIESLTGILQYDDAFKLNLSLRDMLFSRKFHMPHQELKALCKHNSHDMGFTVEPKFLTAGFWNLKGENIKLAEPLDAYKRLLVEALSREHRKSFVVFNYTMSEVILEFMYFKLRLQTDTASVLLAVESSPGIDFESLKQATQDPHLGDNMRRLIENGLVNDVGGCFSVNYDYDKGDVDLFSANYTETKKTRLSLPNIRLDRIMVTEAAIMRFMKRTSLCERPALINIMSVWGFMEDEVMDAMEILQNNNYLTIEENIIKYIP